MNTPNKNNVISLVDKRTQPVGNTENNFYCDDYFDEDLDRLSTLDVNDIRRELKSRGINSEKVKLKMENLLEDIPDYKEEFNQNESSKSELMSFDWLVIKEALEQHIKNSKVISFIKSPSARKSDNNEYRLKSQRNIAVFTGLAASIFLIFMVTIIINTPPGVENETIASVSATSQEEDKYEPRFNHKNEIENTLESLVSSSDTLKKEKLEISETLEIARSIQKIKSGEKISRENVKAFEDAYAKLHESNQNLEICLRNGTYKHIVKPADNISSIIKSCDYSLDRVSILNEAPLLNKNDVIHFEVTTGDIRKITIYQDTEFHIIDARNNSYSNKKILPDEKILISEGLVKSSLYESLKSHKSFSGKEGLYEKVIQELLRSSNPKDVNKISANSKYFLSAKYYKNKHTNEYIVLGATLFVSEHVK